jgi:lactate dehydrogenase-like 2-hydroxyacid dehydrogenase
VKVLATRRFVGPAWDELADVEIGTLDEARDDIEAIVGANERIDEAVLARFPRLRLIANYGVGYDQIDIAACARRGVAVTNTPGVLTAATADLAFALILATMRRIGEGERVIRRGEWTWTWSRGFLGDEVTGATLGIVGLGRIGSAVAQRARGFEMRVVSTTSASTADELDAVLREADAVTVHMPLTPATHGLIDARRLALLRDGATLVNTARGEIVDQDALVRELLSGRIRAGLDVFVGEPEVPAELIGLENVVLTPHLGSATVAAREAMTRLVVDNVLACERGEPLITPISP